MKGDLGKYLGVFIPLLVVVAVPLLLRDSDDQGAVGADLRLDVVTPHNETIRREFGEAFVAWYEAKHGKRVYVNWLIPGGTSEIKRVLDSKFETAMKRAEKSGEPLDVEIDVFFGGGEYDFSQQAKKGRFVKLDLFTKSSELFEWNGDYPVIIDTLGGEQYFSPDEDWVGVCLSSFGICYNLDRLERLGLEKPAGWADLGAAEMVKGLALADPTKSGSVAKSFEMLVQAEIHGELDAIKLAEEAEGYAEARKAAIDAGWLKGLTLIQRIAANSRYFTDSASKIPHDVAQGNAVAGMCIDFYGRTYNEACKDEEGNSRIEYVTPVGGTSVSVDPVAVFKGAPHPELAQEFVNFLLTREAQMIWCAAPQAETGAEVGPKRRALRRLPIRRDLYEESEMFSLMVDGEAKPYELAENFHYDYELTGPLFTPLRNIVRYMCIDSHKEMKAAWEALVEADFPPEATAKFHDLRVVTYDLSKEKVGTILKAGDPVAVSKMSGELGAFFRTNYRETVRLVKEAKEAQKAKEEKEMNKK